MGFIKKAIQDMKKKKEMEKRHKEGGKKFRESMAKVSPELRNIRVGEKRPTIAKGMAKKKMLEQTPTGMANKTGSDAVIPPGHAQRKCKL